MAHFFPSLQVDGKNNDKYLNRCVYVCETNSHVVCEAENSQGLANPKLLHLRQCHFLLHELDQRRSPTPEKQPCAFFSKKSLPKPKYWKQPH